MAEPYIPRSMIAERKISELEKRIDDMQRGHAADVAGPWLTMVDACRIAGLSARSMRQRMARRHNPLKYTVSRFPDGSEMPNGIRLIRQGDLEAEMAAHPVREEMRR